MTKKKQTAHTIGQGDSRGSAEEIRAVHRRSEALQYDFFIPSAVWSHPSVRALLDALAALAGGGTVFSRALGVWEDQSESTNIFRIVVRKKKFNRAEFLALVHEQVGRAMAGLSVDPKLRQDEILFTETKVRMTLTRLKDGPRGNAEGPDDAQEPKDDTSA